MTQKQYWQLWSEFADKVRNTTVVTINETGAEKKARIKRLEADPEAWFKYYFPKYAYAEPAPFHKAATKRILSSMEYYDVRCWSRELAKSARTMMEVLYLTLVRGKRNVLLISNSYDNAVRLLMPFMVHLEHNALLIHDYGQQKRLGSWEAGEFITRKKVSFRAIGAGQSPRGTRNEEARPDIILFDDVDTDEECRNPELIDKKWNWINKAVMGTRSISVPLTVIWCGNIIAEDCCVVRAQGYADHVDIINIRDKAGRSSWPQKNTEDFIDRTLAIIPFSAQQSEYYNNPYTEGKAFKEVQWGKVPPLNRFPFLVAYGDPSTSNSDKGKGASGSSFKSLVLVGRLDQTYYVIGAYVAHARHAEFVDWYYATANRVPATTQLFSYIENNTLQDPFYEMVFKPLFFQKSKEFGRMVSIIPDPRKKPDKYTRIEGTLEPLNRLGFLIFNEAEKENEHMKRLVAQLKSVSPQSKTMDGPDALEGAIIMTNSRVQSAAGVGLFKRLPKKRF